MRSATGLVRVVPDSELQRREREQQETEAAREANNRPVLQGIVREVKDRWNEARDAKLTVLPRLQRAHRARLGEYDPTKLSQIREYGGSEEYARITANKCRIVEAWLRDVFLGQTEKPWTLKPTPKPDFPPDEIETVKTAIAQEVAAIYTQTGQMPRQEEVRAMEAQRLDAFEERLQEEARAATRRMEAKIEDQLTQGGFVHAMGEFLADLTVYPSAIFKGPVLRVRQSLSWEDANGQPAPNVREDIQPEFERVDPFRAYPAPGARTPQEGYFFEHHTFSYSDLYDMIGTPGFDDAAIRAVLREANDGGLNNWLGLNTQDREGGDDTPDHLYRKVYDIDALEYHGPIKGRDLLEWGMEEDDIEDADATYEACVWLVGNWVIKAQLNYDPLNIRPYYAASYEELPGEFWGFGLPDVLHDAQNIANAAVRALVNNMGFASGPQIGVVVDRLNGGEDIQNMHPLKVWQLLESEFGSKDEAIQFFQPQSNASELLQVLETFYRFADDFSLVPRYMAGSDNVSGPARTASGLSMLMDAANKGLKGVVSNIDTNVLKTMLEKTYAHNMMYAEDATLKGDAQVLARGAVSLMQMETLQLRRNEFLNITNNPIDSQITGMSGRAEVLREVARDLELDVNRIVPTREEMDRAEQQQAQAPPEQGQQQSAQGSSQITEETLANGAAVTDNHGPNSMRT